MARITTSRGTTPRLPAAADWIRGGVGRPTGGISTSGGRLAGCWPPAGGAAEPPPPDGAEGRTAGAVRTGGAVVVVATVPPPDVLPDPAVLPCGAGGAPSGVREIGSGRGSGPAVLSRGPRPGEKVVVACGAVPAWSSSALLALVPGVWSSPLPRSSRGPWETGSTEVLRCSGPPPRWPPAPPPPWAATPEKPRARAATHTATRTRARARGARPTVPSTATIWLRCRPNLRCIILPGELLPDPNAPSFLAAWYAPSSRSPRDYAVTKPRSRCHVPCRRHGGVLSLSMPAVVISFLDGEVLFAETPEITFDLPVLEAQVENVDANSERALIPTTAVRQIIVGDVEPAPQRSTVETWDKAVFHFIDGQLLHAYIAPEARLGRHGGIWRLVERGSDEVHTLAIPYTALKAVFQVRVWDSRSAGERDRKS